MYYKDGENSSHSKTFQEDFCAMNLKQCEVFSEKSVVLKTEKILIYHVTCN